MENQQNLIGTLVGVARLTKDLRNAAATLTDNEARYLVDLYYQIQDYRIATTGQIRSIEQAPMMAAKELCKDANGTAKEWESFLPQVPEKEPHETLSFFAQGFANMETDIRKALERYAMSKHIGRWMLSIHGIGPVITAGLLANIDISKAPTAGHIWNYCGLNPDIKWEKGQKRPFNARLKTLCWKIGESFNKTRNSDKDIYGHILAERAAYEFEKNERGDYAEQAAKMLEICKKTGKMKESKKSYEQGKLSPSHLFARSKRYAVKMFLSHLQQVWWEMEMGTPAPQPFAIGILGHAHMIEPPNRDVA